MRACGSAVGANEDTVGKGAGRLVAEAGFARQPIVLAYVRVEHGDEGNAFAAFLGMPRAYRPNTLSVVARTIRVPSLRISVATTW